MLDSPLQETQGNQESKSGYFTIPHQAYRGMNDKIKQLADCYVLVSREQMSPKDFFLSFRSRFEDEVVSAFQRWAENHGGWDSLDWSKIEANPLLSQLISPVIQRRAKKTPINPTGDGIE